MRLQGNDYSALLPADLPQGQRLDLLEGDHHHRLLLLFFFSHVLLIHN